MPEKMPTYRVDEALLRDKMLGYRVEVNGANCEAIEQEIAQLRFKKTINLPSVNLKIVIPVIALLALFTVVYFNADALGNLFKSAPEVKKPEIKISESAVQVNTQTVAVNPPATQSVAAQIPTPMQQNVLSKPDSLPAAKRDDSAKQENIAKKATPVMAEPPSDSASKKAVVSKQDTSVQKADPPVRKKKKRRRNRNMDELRKSTLESNGSDDDVVVPE